MVLESQAKTTYTHFKGHPVQHQATNQLPSIKQGFLYLIFKIGTVYYTTNNEVPFSHQGHTSYEAMKGMLMLILMLYPGQL